MFGRGLANVLYERTNVLRISQLSTAFIVFSYLKGYALCCRPQYLVVVVTPFGWWLRCFEVHFSGLVVLWKPSFHTNRWGRGLHFHVSYLLPVHNVKFSLLKFQRNFPQTSTVIDFLFEFDYFLKPRGHSL